MADNDADKPAADEHADKPEAPKLRVAKVGVKDEGEIVSSALGEPLNGLIADIADGD